MAYIVSELIRRKRDGKSLSPEEIQFLVQGFTNGSIPDYQASAWLMASFIRGLDYAETVELTRGLKNSGRSFRWRDMSSALKHAKFADKHSSGGIGDKVSLVLAPVAAALGITVPMISGRGLGHTGGTVDKLESIPGFSLHISEAKMIQALEEAGCCMLAQMADLCPADGKLYQLRDVTGTVENLSLITASIVSKKWAEGVDAIVYDVKCGEAAFMHNIDEARNLAHSLVNISRLAGMKPLAVISRMDEPLGSMIGNALEVQESLWILTNQFPSENHRRLAEPLTQLTLDLVADMAVLCGLYPDFSSAQKAANQALRSGKAIEIFRRMAKIQGAKDNWETQLPKTTRGVTFESPAQGTLTQIHSRRFGLLGIQMGAGRAHATSPLTHSVGIEMHVRPGDVIEKGTPLLTLHLTNDQDSQKFLAEIQNDFDSIFTFNGVHVSTPGLTLERIS